MTEAAPTLAFSIQLGGGPGYWIHETSGVLRPAILTLMSGENLTDPQIAAIRAYCRQWIFVPGFIGDEVEDLRARVDGLTTQAAIEAWMLDATAACVDPL